jgi:hypothetical protein
MAFTAPLSIVSPDPLELDVELDVVLAGVLAVELLKSAAADPESSPRALVSSAELVEMS